MDWSNNLIFLVRPYWQYAKTYLVGRIAISAVIMPCIAFIEVTLLQNIIDSIIMGKDMAATLTMAITYGAILLLLTLLRWGFLILYDRWKVVEIQNKINRSIYARVAQTDYQNFDNPEYYNDFTFAAGEYASKAAAALDLLTTLCGFIMVSLAMSVYLAQLGPWVIAISLIGCAVCMYGQRLISLCGIAKTKEAIPHERRLAYVHRISYQRQFAADMKSTGLSQAMMNMFDVSGNNRVAVYQKYRQQHWTGNLIMFVAWSCMETLQLVYIIICAYTLSLSVGALTGLFTAAKRLNGQVNQFTGMLGQYMELSLYADKIRTFFSKTSAIEAQPSGNSAPEGSWEVQLRGISFSYPNSSFAVRKMNFTIPAGSKIAIVGENGAGKTTLAKLLLRLYDTDAGEILINGHPIASHDVRNVRHRIGVAFQDPQVYALTVRENLQLYHQADDATLKRVLKTVGLDIPLDAEITREFDPKGIVLSGGQTQKLALARLMHGDFGLLLLDEPSSALDPLAEYELAKLLFDRAHSTTTIMVSHRLSSIRHADIIYMVVSGSIVEFGTHEELMSLGGRYAEMFAKQAENYVAP